MNKAFQLLGQSANLAASALCGLRLYAEIGHAKTKLRMVTSQEEFDSLEQWVIKEHSHSVRSYIECYEMAYNLVMEGESVEEILKV